MGALTRTQMNAEVARAITRDDLSETDGPIDLRLSWAYEIVAEAKYWHVLQQEDKTTTVVTSTQDYAIPSALRTVEYIVMVDESGSEDVFYKLMPEDFEQFRENDRWRNSIEGVPRYWTMVANKIRLYPTPDASNNAFKLHIIGKGKISYFTSDSDTTVLDQKLDRAIIYKATELAYDDLLEEGEEASRYKKKADEAVDNAYGEEIAYSQL